MKIKLFNIPVTVKNGIATLKHGEKVEIPESSSEGEFDETSLALNAQKVASFNHAELEIVKSLGDGDYTVEHKIITE
jgi:hypothetical protein